MGIQGCRFYVTHECNSRCNYCDTFVNDEYKKIISLQPENAENLILQMKEMGCKYIDFTGGEPTLYSNLPRLISFAKSLGMITEVTTNGLLGDDSLVLLCAERSNVFNISLDTLSREKYRQIRGVDGVDRVLRCIDAVVDVRRRRCMDPPKLMTVVSGNNINDIPQLIEYAKEKGTEIYINPIFSYREIHVNEHGHNKFDSFYKLIFEPNVIIPLHFLELRRDMLNNRNGHTAICSANHSILTFAADGSLLTPCYAAENRKFIKIGHRLEQTIQSADFKQTQEQVGKMEECSSCVFTPYYAFSFSGGKYSVLEHLVQRIILIKREYLNKFHISVEVENVSKQLTILMSMLRDIYPVPNEVNFFPNTYFDKIEKHIFRTILLDMQSNKYNSANLCGILINSIEFLIRLWKVWLFINSNKKLKYDIQGDRCWINNYLGDIKSKLISSGSNYFYLPENIFNPYEYFKFNQEQDLMLFDPNATWKKTRLPGGSYQMREILKPIFINGECVYDSPSVMEIAANCRREKDTLWDETQRLFFPHRVYVDLSQKLYDTKEKLLNEMSK